MLRIQLLVASVHAEETVLTGPVLLGWALSRRSDSGMGPLWTYTG
jgi:hypothetical protein